MVSYLDAGKVSVTTPIGPYDLSSPLKGVYTLGFVPGATGVPGIIGDGTHLKSGTYTFTVTGGADVGPVTASIDYPRSFVWNHDAITSVNRSQPLPITWTGGSPGALVSILGNSSLGPGTTSDIGTAFTCWEDATKGSFTVPVSVLSALPPSYTDSHSHVHGNLQVVQAFYGTAFTATGIDYGMIFYSDAYSKGFMPYI